jgi:ribose/xylose/arabinose/galactoside ABC-type transport system permease subunit
LLAHREIGVALILFLTLATVGFINPAFLAPANIRDIAVTISPFAIIACGLTFVILTGEIDISVGSLCGFLAVLLGLLTSRDYAHLPIPLAIPLILLAGTAIGLVNGLLVTLGRVPSIIMTLGMLTALRGVTKLFVKCFANDRWIGALPDALRFLGTGSILHIPVAVLTASAIVIACALAATFTPIGRRIYAVGSNSNAATLAGLSPSRVKLFAFTLTGFLTALATIISVPQLSVIGVGYELLVVTAVVVGGTSISGGKGKILGTLLGLILLGIVRSALLFLKLGPSSTYWERAIQGGFILIAVLVDHMSRPHSED